MKRFLINIILFFLLFYLIDKSFLLVRSKTAFSDHDKRLERVINGKINKDIIVLGSSRGVADIATWVIEDSLKKSAFNLSYGGSNVAFQNYVLEKHLAHAKVKPEYLIKLIDDSFEIGFNPNNGFRFDRLHPLVNYKEIRSDLIKFGNKDKLLSNLFVLHQLSRTNFDLRKEPRKNDTIINYGNLPKTSRKDRIVSWRQKNPYVVSDEKEDLKESFLSIQTTCKKHGVKIIYVVPPTFQKLDEFWVKRMKELVGPENGFYVYNRQDESYKDAFYFLDYSHLNKRGAVYFTNELVGYLKSEMKD